MGKERWTKKPKRKKTQVNALDEAIAKIYYDYGKEGALMNTPSKLLKIARQKLMPPVLRKKLSLKRIKIFLTRQSSYTVHRRIGKRQFQRRKIKVNAPTIRAEADLIELSNLSTWNDGYSYILIVIDTFTKYIWAVPIKTKHGQVIATAFDKIFSQMKSTPLRLYSDAGKEFIASSTQAILKKYNIKHHIGTGEEFHCPFVERANRTIKEKLFQAMTATLSQRWIDLLPLIVKTYNSTLHSTTKMKPIEIDSSNTLTVWKNTYEQKEEKKKKYNFNVGDYVRILKKQDVYTKGYMPRFTWEIFKIVKKADDRVDTKPPAYILEDLSGNIIENALFYEHELSKVDDSLVHGPRAIFPIHKILGKRKGENGQDEVKVWWQGLPEKAAEWVPSSQVYK